MKTSSMPHLSPGRGRRRRKRSAKTHAEFLAPALYHLVGVHDATLSQEQLNVPQDEAEHVVGPDGVADDLGWEPMAVMGVGGRLHAGSLAPPTDMLLDLVIVTMPSAPNRPRDVNMTMHQLEEPP